MKKLVFIASFPPKGAIHHKTIVGGASYTKNTLIALSKIIKKKHSSIDITVLAEKLPYEDERYSDHGIKVNRVWKRNSLYTFPSLFREILIHQKDAKDIIIALELAMFGSTLHLALLLPFLVVLRLLRKDITIIFHHVIADYKEVYGQINLIDHPLLIKLYNILSDIFYFVILHNIKKAIVFEEVLKKTLMRYSNTSVIVIPHGVETFTHSLSPTMAKRNLKLDPKKLTLIAFGYMAWYKGTDLLLSYVKNLPQSLREQIQVVIAGGPNPNHTDKNYYRKYITSVKTSAKQQDVMVTGFVPEESIPLIFQSADVLLFPYRSLIAASGPLSMAFSFQKPFLLSEKISPITHTKDMKECLLTNKVTEDLITFGTQEEFSMKLHQLLYDRSLKEKIAQVSSCIAKKRNWEKIAYQYFETLLN